MSPIVTAARAFIGQNSLDKMLNSEGGSCLEAAISAAFIMALKTGYESQDYQNPEIVGWKSRRKGGFLRKTYRSLLHEHYAVTYSNRHGEEIIITHDGKVSARVGDIQDYMSSNPANQELIIRKIYGLTSDDIVEEDHIKDMKRLARIAEVITGQ